MPNLIFIKGREHLIRGERANRAVKSTLNWIKDQRATSPDNFNRVVFSFPRIQQEGVEGLRDGSGLLAAATVIARDPDSRLDHVREPKIYGDEHSIPSVVVWLNGIRDLEYYVSRQNMERLLEVGCAVFQQHRRRGVFVRIPFNSPLYHGEPFKFKANE